MRLVLKLAALGIELDAAVMTGFMVLASLLVGGTTPSGKRCRSAGGKKSGGRRGGCMVLLRELFHLRPRSFVSCVHQQK
jgi:hypothetical protein